jgi:ABC-type transport system involved in multi-copper enzyme maturation permease subunit
MLRPYIILIVRINCQNTTMQTREWNPIVVRESRARWRGWSAFALVFGYVTLLAIALFWRYVLAYSLSASQANPLQRIELLGAQLFITLIWLQSFAWALIAPAITATTIAAERESGMLEAVQLSPLSPHAIVTGKLVSALSLIALLLLVSIPITGTCLLLGGVSPVEFLAAMLLHMTTAFFGVTLGLACSAWARRANAALRSAYGLSIGWLIASLISFWTVNVTPATGWKWLPQFACTLLGWSNPILATASIADNDAWGTAATISGWGVFETAPWLISVVFQFVLGVLLLWSATRALRRPFAEQYWMGAWRLKVGNGAAGDQAGSTPSPNVVPQSPTSSPRRPASDWISIPIFSGLRFSNPVLQRETRAKFRMRQPPIGVLVFEGILALGVAYYYLVTLRDALFVPAQRELIWWIINFVGLTVVALAAAVSGAGAFSREREIRTWEALRQSLLSPAEILRAKLGATLIGMLVFSLPFWPLLLPCVRPDISFKSSLNGVNVVQAALCAGIIAATAICYTLWGMIWSWRCRTTAAAVGWSLGTLFMALVFVPIFIVAGLLQGNQRGPQDAVWFFHPFVALAFTTDENKLGVSLGTIVFLLVAAGVLWAWLRRKLERER